jgi:glycosyltransferase involved in cell wall biosynthesis
MNHASPIPILHFSNELHRGGAEEHFLQLLKRLDRSLFQPHLTCTPEMREELGSDLPPDVSTCVVSVRKPSDFDGARRLAAYLRRHKIGILHSHMFWASLHAAPVARICGVPVVIETPHLRELWRTGWFKSRFAVDRLAGRFVDRYIAVSKANRDYLVREKGLPARKVSVITNGCDLERFDYRPNQTADLRRNELGIGPEDPVLIVVARLEPQKGHEILLNAFPEVLQEFPTAKLFCIGEGSCRQGLEEQARTLGLEKVVKFVGFQSDVVSWFVMARASILPSYYEGLPLAAIESMAAAVPVVASNVDGIPEVVLNGVTGRTVRPGDSVALAHVIRELLRDPERTRRMGEMGRLHVWQNFDIRRQVELTEALYLREWRTKCGIRSPNQKINPDPLPVSAREVKAES